MESIAIVVEARQIIARQGQTQLCSLFIPDKETVANLIQMALSANYSIEFYMLPLVKGHGGECMIYLKPRYRR